MVEQSFLNPENKDIQRSVLLQADRLRSEIVELSSSGDFCERKQSEIMRQVILTLGDTPHGLDLVWFPAGPLSDRGELIPEAAKLLDKQITNLILINGGTAGQGVLWDEKVHGYNPLKIKDPSERDKIFVWAGTTRWAKLLDDYPGVDLSKNVAWTDLPGTNNPEEHRALLDWLDKYKSYTGVSGSEPVKMGVLCWPHQMPRQMLEFLHRLKSNGLEEKIQFWPILGPVPDWDKLVQANQANTETRRENIWKELQRLINYRYRPGCNVASTAEYEEYLRQRDNDPTAPVRISREFWNRYSQDSKLRETADLMISAAKTLDLSNLPQDWV